MTKETLFGITKTASIDIKNDRNPFSTFNHLIGEVKEFGEELEKYNNGEALGPDGIKGEAMDVLNCTIDIILQVYPDTTEEELLDIMKAKLQKWKEKYGQQAA